MLPNSGNPMTGTVAPGGGQQQQQGQQGGVPFLNNVAKGSAEANKIIQGSNAINGGMQFAAQPQLYHNLAQLYRR
jgi:hypothetical protein